MRGQKDAVLDVSTGKLVATDEDQEHFYCPADSVSTRKLVASGNSETEAATKLGHSFNKLRATHGEGLLDHKKDL